MKGPGGVEYWTTGEATAQLRVDAARLRDWVRRSRAAGHAPAQLGNGCLRCADPAPGFPHVDPPVRAGRQAAYVADQLLAAEAHTAPAPTGGRRRTEDGDVACSA